MEVAAPAAPAARRRAARARASHYCSAHRLADNIVIGAIFGNDDPIVVVARVLTRLNGGQGSALANGHGIYRDPSRLKWVYPRLREERS